MLYTGVDFHKRYSVACTMDATGERIKEARIANTPEAIASYFHALPDASRVVMEACWNWGWLYDLLNEVEGVDEVILANPGKTKIIADAQIKTDRLDAQALCTLLRGQLVARAYAPSPSVRSKKYVLRQRVFWVRIRTRLRNRIHGILDRQRSLDRPVCSDLFGKKGMHWLRELKLPAPDGMLLGQSLAVYDELAKQIQALEKQISAENQSDPIIQRLRSLPGVGPTLASIIATEIDNVVIVSAIPTNSALTLGWHRPPTPPEATSNTAASCLSVIVGCAGRSLKQLGSLSAVLHISAPFINVIVPEGNYYCAISLLA